MPAEAKDYAYCHFGPLSNIEMQPRSDNLYEAAINRNPNVRKLKVTF